MNVERVLFLAWASLSWTCVACGSSSSSDGGDQDAGKTAADASTGDAGTVSDGGPSSDGGPFACGSTSCSGSQYCIHPCCGGARPLCVEIDDAGACPSGTTNNPSACSGMDAAFVCAPDPCTPDPPFCAATATCGAAGSGPSSDPRNVQCVCE